MTPDRKFERDSRVDIESLAHRARITLPDVLGNDGTASGDQLANIAPGTDLKLAMLPHREVGTDPGTWPGAAIVGTREPVFTPYLDQQGPVAIGDDPAISVSRAQSRDAILSWLYDMTGFRHAPAALWKVAGWQIGWLVSFLDRLRCGGAEGALIIAERQAAAAVRAMWEAHDRADEERGLTSTSGAIVVGRALVDMCAAFDRLCREATTYAELGTTEHRIKTREARALLMADMQRYCALIAEANRAATPRKERVRIGAALVVARRMIDAIAVFTVSDVEIDQRVKRLVHVLKTKAKVMKAPVSAVDVNAVLDAVDAELNLLTSGEVRTALERTGWPVATRVGLARLGFADCAARLAVLYRVRTDLVYKLIATRRLDRLYRVLPWMTALSGAFPLTFAGPIGAIAQLFETGRAREIALELKRRLYDGENGPRLDTAEGLAACSTPTAICTAVHAGSRAGFLVAEGAHSHHMVTAYLGGRSFDSLHPLTVAISGSTEWHLGISLTDIVTANTVSDIERSKPVYTITGYDDDLPRYMGLTLVDLLRVALFDIFPGHARGPAFGSHIATTSEVDQDFGRGASAMTEAAGVANRELLRSMLRSIDVDETDVLDEWCNDDAVAADTATTELNRTDALLNRHTPKGKDRTGGAIRRTASRQAAGTGISGAHLRALVDRARTWTFRKDGQIRSEDAPLAAVLSGDALLPGLAPSAQLFVPALWFRPDIDRHIHSWLADGAPMWTPIALNNVRHAGLIAGQVAAMRDAAPALYAAARQDHLIAHILVPLFTGLAGITADHAHVP
jgi:hypothetical protein